MDAASVIISKPWLTDSTAFSSDDSDDEDSPIPTALTITFTLKRSNVGYVYVFLIPIIVMTIISLACFWMDPLGKEKLITNCLLLILLCGFLLSLDRSLPVLSKHTPFLFQVYGWVLLVEGFATIVTVFIIRLVNTSHLRPPPRFICNALTSQYMVSLFLLPKPKPIGEDYGQLSETGETSDCLTAVLHPLDCDSAANNLWGLVAVFCDRLAFIIAIVAYTLVFTFK